MAPTTSRTASSPKRRTRGNEVDGLEALCFYLGRAYFNYKSLLERILVDAGLSKHVQVGMGHVLFALFREDDLMIKEIVARTRLTPSTLTGILDRMQRGGLIRRRRDPHDGRAVRVRLTAQGRAIEAKCHRVLAQIDGVLHRGMTAREVKEFKRMLGESISSLRADLESRKA